MVITMPEPTFGPATVIGVTRMPGVRLLALLDYPTGQPREETLGLGEDRGVVVHDLPVAHHKYTNTSDDLLTITLLEEAVEVPPGATYLHIGGERADVFPPSLWSHVEGPLDIESSHG